MNRAWLHVPSAIAVALLLPLVVKASDPPTGSLPTTVGAAITWNGTATGSGSADESTCVEGVNCDTFMLTVAGTPSAWAKKLIKVDVTWGIQANDYDLYIHKGTVDGPVVNSSGGGAPQTGEATIIDPFKDGTGDFAIRVVYFATTPQVDQPKGRAAVINRPPGRTAIYLNGGVRFGPSFALRAPAASRDGEPSLRVDKFGNAYVAGIRGVPAGVDLWYFDLNPCSPTYDPYMRNPIYRGQPDSFTQDESMSVGADGGGDVDLAVGFDEATGGQPPALAFSSLVAANISTARSLDKGQTWTLNPAGNVTGGIPVDDRQWLEFYGKDVVYLLYRTLAPAVTQIQRSNDGGLTYGPARTAGQLGQVGTIDVDKNDGTVYISGSTGKIGVGIPDTPGGEPLTYNVYQVTPSGASVANIFFVVKVADDGTAYVCYSDGKNVYLTHSTDKGVSWAPAIKVNSGGATRTSMLPWIETGPTPGSVGVVWYGSSAAGNVASARWKVFYAGSMNAMDQVPVFNQTTVTQHHIHSGVISTGGTLGDQNRNLLDYFQIAFDPLGMPVIAYTDDHNDFDGHTYVARGITGMTPLGPKITSVTEGAFLPGATTPAHHVEDFQKDVTEGLLVMLPLNDPLDIDWVDYSTENSAAGKMLVAKMHVTDLATVPPLSNWRMHFSANAPFPAVSPTKDFTFGLSDEGDQFYVRAFTDAAGARSYVWGTAVRNPDGTLTYTQRGTADAGAIDPATGTITVKVKVSQLNAFARSPIVAGSVICGLRAAAYSSGSSAGKWDDTRGGTRFVVK